jgi:branched-subunit amino acid aminotransferase/4-amino-4-deoxychorismate lyase
MEKYYDVNGQITPAQEASLKVNDLAILRGFGIFDFFLVWDYVPLFMEDYLDRFYRSAELIHLEVPASRAELKARIHKLIQLNGQSHAGIRLVMTGGYSEDSYTPIQPNLLVMHHNFKPFDDSAYTEGIKLMTFEYQRDLPEVKTTNYAMGIRLIPQLNAVGATEPLYHSNGTVKEAVRSNFFIIQADNTIVTADEDILYGITRKHVLAAAAPEFKIEKRLVRVEELWQAKEAFLTGSNKGVIPITRIDEHVYGDGNPGEATMRIKNLFDQYRTDYIKTHSPVNAE